MTIISTKRCLMFKTSRQVRFGTCGFDDSLCVRQHSFCSPSKTQLHQLPFLPPILQSERNKVEPEMAHEKKKAANKSSDTLDESLVVDFWRVKAVDYIKIIKMEHF